jgi:predicted PurR-regulated permease PerM
MHEVSADPAEDALLAAEAEAEGLRSDPDLLTALGPPVNRRSPYMVGLYGAAGVITTVALAWVLLQTASVLLLIGLALFLAIGLEPAVQWLTRLRIPRWAAVGLVSAVMLAGVIGFVAGVIPQLVAQAQVFLTHLPTYLDQITSGLKNRDEVRAQLDQLTRPMTTGSVYGGLLGAGKFVLNATASTLTVLVLTIYLLADMPRIRALIYQLIPASRRPRAILLGDEMLAKVGGYVLGNLLTSVIAGLGTFVWLVAWHVPYAALLAITVAVLDLIPIIGAPLGGAIVTLVALTVSVPVAIATLLFYTAYKLLEDYLLVPRIIGRTVDVPATVTLVAVLIGGAALGVLGAIIAIPVAAALRLWLREIFLPRLDAS